MSWATHKRLTHPLSRVTPSTLLQPPFGEQPSHTSGRTTCPGPHSTPRVSPASPAPTGCPAPLLAPRPWGGPGAALEAGCSGRNRRAIRPRPVRSGWGRGWRGTHDTSFGVRSARYENKGQCSFLESIFRQYANAERKEGMEGFVLVNTLTPPERRMS